MIDTQYLEKKIADSGKTKTHLASKMGISIQSFRLKTTNKYDFTTSEVAVLCDELGIRKLSEKEKIFFAK
jgi:DNA-binding Xre family transcriptional regulator